ncbi:MAG: hypothetical protein LR008_01770 [Candidatus Pacebacteria bacterium]|nr:hypothetical protein [Candidatus Paceibacterota bacterium]
MKIDSVDNLIEFHPVIHVVLIPPKDSFYCRPDDAMFYLWTSEEKANYFLRANNLPPGEVVVCDTERTVEGMKKLSFKRIVLDFVEEKTGSKYPNYCVIEI